jgi:drug/metabolite transporter (DMT)-like permease
MSYFFLLLSLLSSVAVALILKVSDRRQEDGLTVIAANYPVALLLGLVLSQQLALSAMALLLAVVMGFLFLASFVLYGWAIAREGVTSSVTMGRISLAIPVGLSILIWGEMPKLHHWPALIMIMLIIFFWEGRGKKISWLLLTLFLLFGINDTGMKVFKMYYRGVDDGVFLLALFASAGFWAWLWVWWRGQKPVWSDIRTGLLLGVPNYGSTYFLLKALNSLPGYLVFPFVNVGAVILAYLAGHLLFSEEMGRRKLFLVILGALAVLLLTV